MSYRKKSMGFTLMELMIVVVIVGILAMIAYPAYTDQLRKTRRSDGQAFLLDIMAHQERYYTEKNTYTTSLATDLSYSADTNAVSPEGYYQVTASACGTDTLTACVLLTATPQGTQATDGNLTLNSRNVKTGNW